MSPLNKRITDKSKSLENSYNIEKILNTPSAYFKTNSRGVVVFLTSVTTCGLLFLGGSSVLLKEALTVENKPVEVLMSEVANISNYSVRTNETEATTFSLFSQESTEPVSYVIRYETEAKNVESFISEINTFVESIRESGASTMELNVSSFRFKFQYSGAVGAEHNPDRLNVALMMLREFSDTSYIYSVEVVSEESVDPEAKPIIDITTTHSLISSANIASHFPKLLEGRFSSSSWFNNYNFNMNVAIRTGERLNGTPIVVSSLLKSVEDVEAAKNIDINVYYNLYELTQLKWVTNPKEISFIHGNPFTESVIRIVVVSTERDELLEAQMYQYWMRGNPIFRPQPYFVQVTYNSIDGRLAFGLGR